MKGGVTILVGHDFYINSLMYTEVVTVKVNVHRSDMKINEK